MAVEVARIVERMQAAGSHWESALDARALAPPDAGFSARVRSLSEAAAEQAQALKLAAEGGLRWRSRAIDEDFVLAPELSPGMNRQDRRNRGTGSMMRSTVSPPRWRVLQPPLAGAFARLSEAADALATDVQPLYRAGRLAG